MFCMNCGLELPEDAKFCRKCASPLTSCPECGEELPHDARYCWKCGNSLTSAEVSSGLKEPEEPGSLLDEPENDPENVLPAKSDNASIFARMSSAKSAETAQQNSAPSPFKQSAGAKRESSASSYSPAGMPSAFKPASEKKKKENETPEQPAPSPYNRFSEAASPFKPLGSAKTESAPARPAAPRGTAAVTGSRPGTPRGAASVAGSRPAAPRGAASVGGSRPAAPRGAAAVAGSRPAASLRPEPQETNEEPAKSASPASPFKPLGSAKTGSAPSRPAAPRGAASVGGSRPAAPRGAAAVAGTRPAASAPRAGFRPAAQAQAAAKEEPADEAPAAAPSGPFKPFAPAKTAAAPAKPAASANSAFKPAASNTAKEEPVIENEAPAATLRPSPPVTFVPSGLFKPLASPEEPKEEQAPQTPSPFASSMTSSPFASGSAFSPLTSSEPDLEVPKKSFGFTAYRPGMSSSEDKAEDKKPVNPTAMFNMNSNSGSMSSLGGDDIGSLSSLGSPDAGSLVSDGFEDSDEKLPQRDGDHPRFFRRTAPAPAPEVAPEPTHVPDMKFNLPKVEPMKPKAFSSSNPSPFRSVLNAGTDDEKPVEREPGASPFKPLRT